MIKINGTTIPSPTNYGVGIMDINKMERNANGNMIGERINTKRKIELAWEKIEASDLSIVLNLVSPLFFSVEYIDPQEQAIKTGTFYAGDRTSSGMIFKNGTLTHYKDFKFNLIER